MSFFDDASLVFLPSGQAGKDGKAYSMKPVPEYGSELVTNGGFDTDSDWNKTNATISGGVATITSTGYAYAAIVQNNVLTIGKTYYATIDVNSIVGGLIVGTSETITSSGIASVTFTATNTYLDIRRDSAFATTTAVIDNVSVREVVVGDGDFTFSRGSNLTATRVDSNGLIEKGRENLLKQSNQFDTTWTISEGTILGGQTGYDGSSDAWLYTDNVGTTSKSHDVRQSVSESGVNCFSIYAKMGTKAWVKMYNGLNTCFFNIDPNYVGNRVGTDNTLGGRIEDVGNGWFRLSVFDNGSASLVLFGIAGGDGSGNYISDGTGTLYIQDAQLEQGLVATEYIESGATTGLAGILEDSPRFDYSGGASCPSLLLEPSRTNLVTQSEYFDDWTNSEETDLSVNNTTSPEGVQNAYSITPQATSNYHRINKSITIVSGNQYSFSFFAKANGNDFILLRTLISGGNRNVCFNISNGTIDFESSFVDNAIIEDYGNGWYRCSVVWTATTSGQTIYLRSQISTQVGTDDGINTFTGNGNGAYLFGAQMEQGSYSTSYIPNHSGGSVTRDADDCGGAGTSSTFNDDEGVLYVEASALANDGTSRMIALSDATSANHIRIYPTTTDNRITIAIKSGNVNQYVYHYDGLSDITDTWKVAVRYKRNDFATFVNGVKVDSSSSGSVATGLDELQFNGGASANYFYGKSNQVLVFNSYLSDSEIITLTS